MTRPSKPASRRRFPSSLTDVPDRQSLDLHSRPPASHPVPAVPSRRAFSLDALRAPFPSLARGKPKAHGPS